MIKILLAFILVSFLSVNAYHRHYHHHQELNVIGIKTSKLLYLFIYFEMYFSLH
jgi:hypothetical protein